MNLTKVQNTIILVSLENFLKKHDESFFLYYPTEHDNMFRKQITELIDIYQKLT